jgi:hypothetical protein
MSAITIEKARWIAVRGYCHPENSHKVLDGDLCEAIAREIVKATSVDPLRGPSALAPAWGLWAAMNGRDGAESVTNPAMYRVGPEPTEPAADTPLEAKADARSEPRPVADQLRWHEPPKSTADAFAAESDADVPLEVPAR